MRNIKSNEATMFTRVDWCTVGDAVEKTAFSGPEHRGYTFRSACMLAALFFILVAGCTNYKEELRGAQQQIEKLGSELGQLTDLTARLEKDKQQLKGELATLTDTNTKLADNLDELKRTKAANDLENMQLKKKNTDLQNELQSLKGREAELERQINSMKKQVADAASQGPAADDKAPEHVGGKARVHAAQQSISESDPCDAVIQYMKAAARIIKEQKGERRQESLKDLKKEYVNRMQGAPDSAKKAAEEWVVEAGRMWDKPRDQSTYNLLRTRNIVLDACGRKPVDLGF